MAARYESLSIDEVELDVSNPRIAEILTQHVEVSAELIALALGGGRDTDDGTTHASLKESIKANGTIINPIIVRQNPDGSYIAIEGNTRLQIYKDFAKNGTLGSWTEIPALVYTEMADDEIDAIRLQAHLVGPRPWDAYAKARYLNELANVKRMPMNQLVPFCGGKTSEVTGMIAAYNDIENYYRPILHDRGISFNPKHFSAFRELQNKTVLDALVRAGFTKSDFAEWVADGKIITGQDPRSLPKVLRDEDAKKAFLTKNMKEAQKVLSAKEVHGYRDLDNIPSEVLATVLSHKLSVFPAREVPNLRTAIEYEELREALYNLSNDVAFMIGFIEGDNG